MTMICVTVSSSAAKERLLLVKHLMNLKNLKNRSQSCGPDVLYCKNLMKQQNYSKTQVCELQMSNVCIVGCCRHVPEEPVLHTTLDL